MNVVLNIAEIPGGSAVTFGRHNYGRALWLLPIGVALLAVLQQALTALDCDVSWLLTVGEKMLGGARLYTDIFEVNPPASVLIYLPGIALARAIGAAPEFTTALLVFVLAFLSIGSAGRLLIGAGLTRDRTSLPLACAALTAFLLVPAACFAQREHIALLTLLPFIAVLMRRMEGEPIGRIPALLSGCGAGITIAIKPHFAVPVVLMLLFVMWRRKTIRSAFAPEMWTTAIVALAYAATVLLLFPQYLDDALPLLMETYVPSRASFAQIWLSPAMWLFWTSAALCLFVAGARLVNSRAIIPLIASIGFVVAVGLQGRGYLNHVYPAVALSLFAGALALVDGYGEHRDRLFGSMALLLLSALACHVFANIVTFPEMTRLVQRVAPPHPRMIAISSDLSVGHPATRAVGGRWVGRRASLWVTGAALHRLSGGVDAATRATLNRDIAADRRILVEDIDRGRPDVVLVEGSAGLRYIRANSEVGRVMGPYRSAGTADDVHVFVRLPHT